jgi:hypothetical protein
MPRLTTLIATSTETPYPDTASRAIQLLSRLAAADCMTEACDIDRRAVVDLLANTPRWREASAQNGKSLPTIGLAKLILILFDPSSGWEGASCNEAPALSAAPQCTVGEAHRLLANFNRAISTDPDSGREEVAAAVKRACAAVAQFISSAGEEEV